MRHNTYLSYAIQDNLTDKYKNCLIGNNNCHLITFVIFRETFIDSQMRLCSPSYAIQFIL